MEKELKVFSNFDDLKEFVLETRYKKKLHSLTEKNLTILLEEINIESYPVSEINVDGGRVDLKYYLPPSNYNIHFEIFASKTQVPQDLRLLEQSKSDIRIAILLDKEIDPSISTDYFRKRPSNPFPSVNLSDIFLESKLNDFKDKIGDLIERKSIGKTKILEVSIQPYVRMELDGRVLPDIIIDLRAVNKSIRPITVLSCGLFFIDESIYIFRPNKSSSYIYGESPRAFPIKLQDGDACHGYFTASYLEDQMEKHGIKYPIKIKAFFDTNDGRFFSEIKLLEE